MKCFPKIMLALFLAVLTAVLLPVQVFAEVAPTVYISEVKVFEGSYDQAESEGFTLLKGDDDKPVDLNQNAGGGLGSKGDKAVYLGYKTTNDKNDAITDLALMNMKGGYNVAEYEALMETRMKSEILPFVEKLFVAIQEYRANYQSENEENKQRALYFRDALNKLTDDDCDGKGLGDLLLNETKYEMGDEAYNKLSESKKKNHADLVTIVAQCNGRAMLQMADFLTRASDNNEDTWLDRFAELTYDDLVDATGKSPNDAKKELAKLYESDAVAILEMWDAFREQLLKADEAKEELDKVNADQFNETGDILNEFDLETAEQKDVQEFAEASVDTEVETELLSNRLNDYVAKEYLASIPYEDGTMLDFFTQEYEEVADHIEMLYPLVASLSPGQRAGLDYITLSTLVSIAGTSAEAYKEAKIDGIEPVSIYEEVDRGIYQKGGVALTSDALRKNKNAFTSGTSSSSFPFSWWTILSAGSSLSSAVAFGVSTGMKISTIRKIAAVKTAMNDVSSLMTRYNEIVKNFSSNARTLIENGSLSLKQYNEIFLDLQKGRDQLRIAIKQENDMLGQQLERLSARNSMCNKLMIGFGVAMIVLTAVTTYLGYRDMVSHYKVEFTPIPHYIVDAKDLISYNSKGEKIVLKNQSAYYKVAESNRAKGDLHYDDIGTSADLNGCVGKQWLALYAAKNEAMEPISAASLKVMIDDEEVPAGYTTGVHMFGSESAFNLNSNLYVWKNNAKSIFIYYQTEDSEPSAAGSTFSRGYLALFAIGGLAVGAGLTALIMTIHKKRKESKNAKA